MYHKDVALFNLSVLIFHFIVILSFQRSSAQGKEEDFSEISDAVVKKNDPVKSAFFINDHF